MDLKELVMIIGQPFNKFLQPEYFPVPSMEEVIYAMSWGQKFTKLDLIKAYHQILLDDESQELVTVSTHRGLYRHNRLPFGDSPASLILLKKKNSWLV